MVQRKTLSNKEIIEFESSETTATRLDEVSVDLDRNSEKPTFIVKRAFLISASTASEAIEMLDSSLEAMAQAATILRAQMEQQQAIQELEGLSLPPLFGTGKREPNLPS